MIAERITHTVAVGAVSSPFWLPDLATVSNYAAMMLPILGCGWLVVQILLKIFRNK